jgi:hypothetical protein
MAAVMGHLEMPGRGIIRILAEDQAAVCSTHPLVESACELLTLDDPSAGTCLQRAILLIPR